ncbi:MAG: LemA family protein [Hyphomicrobiaceae bacterium]|nr:LemA family protein [Hyphomicrobiaceae bacterium]
MTLWISVAVAAALVLAIVAIYNRLVALARRCDQSSADIDVQLKQRHDLIPSLVETVKGYASHERGTLEEVMRARNAATASPSAGAEAALGGALGRLMAVAEAYPDLKASQNFTALQDELSDLENKIAAARRFLNSATNEYNTTREQFPANIVASMFDFESRETVVIAKDSRVTFDTAPSIRF